MGKHVRRGLGREQPQSKWWDTAEDSRMRVVAQIMGVKILWSIRVFRHPTIKTAVWPFWGRLASGPPVTENRGQDSLEYMPTTNQSWCLPVWGNMLVGSPIE